MSSASIQETLQQINNTLKGSKEGPYANYSCKNVSWDDVQRGTVGDDLSCWGANITDTRLFAKDGRQLFTVRGDNWNERLGKVTSSDIALVATATGATPSTQTSTTTTSPLRPYTLREVLSRSSEFGAYAGLKEGTILSDDVLDKEVSVRFQTTFLPVKEDEGRDKSTLEFAPEAYNYNTHRDDDPRNLIILCTSQGLAIQQDGKGSKKLFHHHATAAAAVDRHRKDKQDHCDDGGGGGGGDGGRTGVVVKRYWLEAESSRHKVGGAQVESKKEKDDAIQRGKATSSVIGVRGIGTRFNVLMTIQVPLQQQKLSPQRAGGFYYNTATAWNYTPPPAPGMCAGGNPIAAMSMAAVLAPMASTDIINGNVMGSSAIGTSSPKFKWKAPALRGGRGRGRGGMVQKYCRSLPQAIRTFGTSSAARVSRGSEVDTWKGLTVKNPKRHKNEHITVTIVMYYTCSGGVPTAQDVKSAIDDLEELYCSVEENGNLSEDQFDFMKSELTVNNVMDIEKKLVTQPPPPSPPKPPAPMDFDVFPSEVEM